MPRPRKHETFLYRVYKKVRPMQNGCFEFYGHLNQDGYGRINKNGKLVYIHRELWKMFRGDIPKNICICHKCDNPSCVNLHHMFIGTHADNMADRKTKKRYAVHIGSKNGSSRLKEKDIPVIRDLIAKGESFVYIANIYGVSEPNIRHIKNGKIWKHV